MHPYRSLICLSLLHGVVDTYAMLIEPLWPKLSREFHFSATEEWLLLTVALLAINFSQPVFGYFRDRWNTTRILWLGPLVGVICLPLLGWISNPGAASLILMAGMVGMGAFHPEGVVTAGAILPAERTRGISTFLVGGTIGLGVGPLLGGFCVQNWGLAALPWLIVPGVILVVLLEVLGRPGFPSRNQQQSATQQTLTEFLRAHGGQASLLLLVAMLRVLPAVGIPKAIAFTLAQQHSSTGLIGMTQSVFLSSGSIGMLWLAGRFQHGKEHRHLVIDPLIAIPLMVGLALAGTNLTLTLLCLTGAGLVLNGTTAVLISYSHQLFPRSTGIASSLTMGFAWGLSGIVVASLTTQTARSGHPETMYWFFVPSLLASSSLALLLPRRSVTPATTVTTAHGTDAVSARPSA